MALRRQAENPELRLADYPGHRHWCELDLAGTLLARTRAGGGFGSDFEITGDLQPMLLNRGVAAPRSIGEIISAMRPMLEPLVSHNLRGVGSDASEDGSGRGRPLTTQVYSLSMAHRSSNGWGVNETSAFTLDCSGPSAVAVALRGREGGGAIEVGEDCTNAVRSSQGGGDKARALVREARRISFVWVVRYLTPRECERLQGIPDDHTLIPWRNGMASDSARYKAIGNGMAVPCVGWLLERIDRLRRNSDAARFAASV